ncbi:MAG: histone deacetylase family protein [Anaerolineaceae bacterium]|nr:histone deacetylase family protein [Anaerolineaceae bacterium]
MSYFPGHPPSFFLKQVKNLTSLIPVLYSADHLLHQPEFEFDRGTQIPYQEVARRIESTREALLKLPNTLEVNPQLNLTSDLIAQVHSPDLITHLINSSEAARLQSLSSNAKENLYLYPWIFPLNQRMRTGLIKSPDPTGCFSFDTYSPIGSGTWQAVLASANLAYYAAQLVASEKYKLAYALCRPPGHHAAKDMFGGYCYLNNAAIAARQLNQTMGRGVILDIDYHHGNGTQDIFWDDPDVFFISLHADPVDEYPFFSGYADERGGESAMGTNLNLPLHKGCDDQSYLQALDLALGAIRQFNPHWLVLSAGYDTCAADPSTFFGLNDDVYSVVGNRIGELQLPVVIIHEGGYAVEHNGILAARLLQGIIDSLNE